MILMQVQGATGSATAQGYAAWTQVHGLSIGLERELATASGSKTWVRSGSLTFQPVDFNFVFDVLSSHLYHKLLKGENLPLIEIHVCEPGKKRSPYIQIKLKNSTLASHESMLFGNLLPLEQVTLHCDAIEKTECFNTSNLSPMRLVTGFQQSEQTAL